MKTILFILLSIAKADMNYQVDNSNVHYEVSQKLQQNVFVNDLHISLKKKQTQNDQSEDEIKELLPTNQNVENDKDKLFERQILNKSSKTSQIAQYLDFMKNGQKEFSCERWCQPCIKCPKIGANFYKCEETRLSPYYKECAKCVAFNIERIDQQMLQLCVDLTNQEGMCKSQCLPYKTMNRVDQSKNKIECEYKNHLDQYNHLKSAYCLKWCQVKTHKTPDGQIYNYECSANMG